MPVQPVQSPRAPTGRRRPMPSAPTVTLKSEQPPNLPRILQEQLAMRDSEMGRAFWRHPEQAETSAWRTLEEGKALTQQNRYVSAVLCLQRVHTG